MQAGEWPVFDRNKHFSCTYLMDGSVQLRTNNLTMVTARQGLTLTLTLLLLTLTLTLKLWHSRQGQGPIEAHLIKVIVSVES